MRRPGKAGIIGTSFEDYLQTIYGPNADKLPAMQRGELEQAYYGAIFWVLEALADRLGPDAEPTDADLELVNQIYIETQAYSAIRHASLTFNFERGKPKAEGKT